MPLSQETINLVPLNLYFVENMKHFKKLVTLLKGFDYAAVN